MVASVVGVIFEISRLIYPVFAKKSEFACGR
jgi:hypothetical protein